MQSHKDRGETLPSAGRLEQIEQEATGRSLDEADETSKAGIENYLLRAKDTVQW